MNSGTLFVVATPIGNLEDITIRGLEVLRTVDAIACEDTRKSRILLQKWDISARLVSLHKFSESRKTEMILERLAQGQAVAIISDAGTPAISDPGSRLVRSALDADSGLCPFPGRLPLLLRCRSRAWIAPVLRFSDSLPGKKSRGGHFSRDL